MKKVKIKEILSVISVMALLFCAFSPVDVEVLKNSADADTTVSTYTTAFAAQESGFQSDKVEKKTTDVNNALYMSDEQLANRFVSMLNINNAFNDALEDEKMMVVCSAVSLSEYAQDVVGYGLCVNTCLAEGFAESFYGKKLSGTGYGDAEVLKGYIALPQMGMDINVHTLVSFDLTDDGYEVLSCMRSYDGGEEYATCLVKSLFVRNSASEFGFNLVSCEVL